jgi:uncharacterized protein with PIN domain
MNFIVDAMFGHLARWLRISGYDTLYDVELKDGRLIMIAKKEGRALITRDKDVYSRATKEGVKATYIDSLDFQCQLEQIIREYGITLNDSPTLARCPKCNSKLGRADKKDIKAELPERVKKAYNEFWKCEGCHKVYWQGGHWKSIRETVNKLRSEKM